MAALAELTDTISVAAHAISANFELQHPARVKARPSGACPRPERPRGAIERQDAAALEHDEPARIVKRRRRRSRPEHFEVEVRRIHADRGLHGWYNKIGEAGKGANRAVLRAGPRRR